MEHNKIIGRRGKRLCPLDFTQCSRTWLKLKSEICILNKYFSEWKLRTLDEIGLFLTILLSNDEFYVLINV